MEEVRFVKYDPWPFLFFWNNVLNESPEIDPRFQLASCKTQIGTMEIIIDVPVRLGGTEGRGVPAGGWGC